MNISRFFASIFSFIFHPLLMPTAGIFLIFHSGTPESLFPFAFSRYIYLLVSGGTFILPLCLMPFYLYSGVISSYTANSTRERNLPLLFTSVLYFFTSYYLYRLPLQNINLTIAFTAGCAICVLLIFLINLKWKISAHMTGMGGIIGLIVALRIVNYPVPVLFLIFLVLAAGIVFWARMELESHTSGQLLTGFVTGISVISLVTIIFNLLQKL